MLKEEFLVGDYELKEIQVEQSEVKILAKKFENCKINEGYEDYEGYFLIPIIIRRNLFHSEIKVILK